MALPQQPVSATAATYSGKKNAYLLPFILVTSLFFLWGLAHNLDSYLIPHLKVACQLSNRQSVLVDTAVFLAYFLMAIPAGAILKKFGYKNSILTGLLVFALGAFLFIPAANALSFQLFLVALFIIGCGLTILETTANPYAAVLGDPSGAAFRLNLAASFNGVAAPVAGLVGTALIFSGNKATTEQINAMDTAAKNAYLLEEASTVKLPYLILGGILVLIALIFFFANFPEVKNVEKEESRGGGFLAALRHRHLSWAVAAQFFYVGAQVCVTSFFIRVAEQGAGMDRKAAGYYYVVYGVLFMAGRFGGTALLKFVKSQTLLAVYAVIAVFLCLVAIFGQGTYVVYCLGGLGFFMSIMFPTIFALGIDGIGEDTKAGSSWLVMSIIGGAILPYFMAWVIDASNDNIQLGYLVPLICFAVILLFALNGYKIKHKLVADRVL